MDSSTGHIEDDEWDNDNFVIPSLGLSNSDSTVATDPQPEPKSPYPKTKEEDSIYLGPHGAPPFQTKQQELNVYTGRKQHFRQKLKEADKRTGVTGRENKIENIRELVGGRKEAVNMSNGSNRDWLDPHCDESQFEKLY